MKQARYHHLQEVEEVKTSGGSTTSIAELLEQFLPTFDAWNLDWEIVWGRKASLSPQTALGKPMFFFGRADQWPRYCDFDSLGKFLAGFAGPVLKVSRSLFLGKVATKDSAFEDGKILPFFGHYTDYLDEKSLWNRDDPIKCKRPKRRKWSRSVKIRNAWPTKKSRRGKHWRRYWSLGKSYRCYWRRNAGKWLWLWQFDASERARREKSTSWKERYEYLGELAWWKKNH